MNLPAEYEQILLIGETDTTVSYRARRKLDQKPVILKHLKKEYPSFQEIADFQHEFDILKDLSIPGVLKPIGLDARSPVINLILEDFDGHPLETEDPGEPWELGRFFDVSINLAKALGELHQHHIIHKCIKPDNILVHPSTGDIRIINFQNATKLNREQQMVSERENQGIELAYISPEQTGRMNRLIDYRTDFYSLGINFYRLLTGKLPFRAKDPLEMVYSHIAKEALSPSDLHPEIPSPLSAVVLKLIAKAAEDRYQGAFGLSVDLEFCRDKWRDDRAIPIFDLGSQDVSNRFKVPQGLYGRETELARLKESFEKTGKDRTEVVIISGRAGTGKTSIVNEIQKFAVKKRAFFICGKVDRFKQNLPYGALVQAVQELVRQVLTETDSSIERWRTRLLGALGASGRVITDVIPDVAMIIGDQPPVTHLGQAESQKRFLEIFLTFIRVFTKANRPIVIFLDDLHWADATTLTIFKTMASDKSLYNLMIIGAFRNQEKEERQLLFRFLDGFNQEKIKNQHLVLEDLDKNHTRQMIADTLFASHKRVQKLSTICYQKTHGNPFFVVEFLKRIYRENLLEYDFRRGTWHWDSDQIRTMDITGNVVDLLVDRIQKLPSETQEILMFASCIGTSFTIQLVSVACSKKPTQISGALYRAVQENLIFPLDDSYKYLPYGQKQDENFAIAIQFKFMHERLQQAAYSLIPRKTKARAHLAIGRSLMKNKEIQNLGENIFEVANHLEYGIGLVEETAEQLQMATLNLEAGKRAMQATAFEAATRYLDAGLRFLPNGKEKAVSKCALQLHLEKARCALTLNQFEEAERHFNQLMQQPHDVQEETSITHLGIQIFTTLGKHKKAVTLGLQGLRQLGMEISNEVSKFQVWKTWIPAAWFTRKTKLREIIGLPEMNDQGTRAIVALLMEVAAPAAQCNPNLWRLLVLKAVLLSMQQGNAPTSPLAFVQFGSLLGHDFNRWGAAFRLGKLAIRLSRQYYNPRLRGKVLYHFGKINHRNYHMKRNVDYFREALKNFRESGDVHFTNLCMKANVDTFEMCGFPLSDLEQLVAQYRGSSKEREISEFLWIVQEWVESLREQPENENAFLNPNPEVKPYFMSKTSLNHFLLLAMKVSYLFGRPKETIAHAEHIREVFGAPQPASLHYPEYLFYQGLSLLELLPDVSPGTRKRFWKKIVNINNTMGELASWCPENYRAKYLLMEAVVAHRRLQSAKAIKFFDETLNAAHVSGFTQVEAMAKELAGRFYLERGMKSVAKVFLRDACYNYSKWEASGKVSRLNEMFPELLSPDGVTRSRTDDFNTGGRNTGALVKSSNQMDLTTLIKTSQTISSEIDYSKLLDRTMHFLIENAGAGKGFLILQKDGHLVIEAEGDLQSLQILVRQSQPIQESGKLCHAVVRYVERTLEPLTLDHAFAQGMFTQNSYVRKNHSKSILCLPILSKSRLTAIIYLENDVITGAFTPERLEILKVLSAQVAISIENATLYEHLDEYNRNLSQKVEERTQKLRKANMELVKKNEDLIHTQNQLIMQEKMASLGTLAANIAHEIKNPINFINNFAAISGELAKELNSHIHFYRDHFKQEDFREVGDLLANLEQNAEFISLHSGRANEIVNSMLSFSVKSSNRKEMCLINEVLFQYADIAYRGRLVEQAGEEILFRKELDSSLTKAEVVPESLGRVIVNLLNNAFDAAIQFQTEKGGQPTVTLFSKDLGNEVEIRVWDNGSGIPEEIQDKIYTPFFTTKPPGKGIGLGLATCYDVIFNEHKGSLEFDSQWGKSTEFIIRLPKVDHTIDY